MNAQDYLLRQGWAGPGTPLNPTRQRAGGPHGGLGLTKPILVARRKGNEGVGKKTTKDPTNQWWLRGFEDALKGVGGEGGGQDGQDTGLTGRTPNALTSELYRFFVRGKGLAGTVGSRDQEKGKEEKVKGKRKRDDGDDEIEKKEKKKRKDKDDRKESKEERRQRKQEKKLKKECKAEGVSKHKEKKSKKESKPEDNYPTPASTEHESSGQDEAVKLKHSKSKDKTKEKKDKKESKKTTPTSGDDKATRKSKKTKKDK